MAYMAVIFGGLENFIKITKLSLYCKYELLSTQSSKLLIKNTINNIFEQIVKSQPNN